MISLNLVGEVTVFECDLILHGLLALYCTFVEALLL